MEMDTLTAPLLKELIDRIEVSEVEGKGKNRTQRIVIHYRFAGYIDLERDYLESNIVQDRGYIGSSSASVFVAVGSGHAFEELVICRYR